MTKYFHLSIITSCHKSLIHECVKGVSYFISRQGQMTWNTDCADDADAHGYELPNQRISAQSAASAFPFRFDDYFINPRQIKLIHEPRFSGNYPKKDIGEHFADVSKMIMIGNEAKRSIDDIMLSFQNRSGSCSLQDEGSFSYHLLRKKSSDRNADDADPRGYDIRENPRNPRHPCSIYDNKLRRENIRGKENANMTHFVGGKKVRQTIKELGGTMPEDLELPEKSIQEIEEKPKKRLLRGELE